MDIILPQGTSPSMTYAVEEILRSARLMGNLAPVSFNLVGAHLANRFPDVTVDEAPFQVGDALGPLQGHFHIGDAAIFVHVEPTSAHLRRCVESLEAGFGPILLVPLQELEEVTRYSREFPQHEFVEVSSIEHFVGISMEWMSDFSHPGRLLVLRGLRDAYNDRVIARSDLGERMEFEGLINSL